jgi:hypothetical protein
MFQRTLTVSIFRVKWLVMEKKTGIHIALECNSVAKPTSQQEVGRSRSGSQHYKQQAECVNGSFPLEIYRYQSTSGKLSPCQYRMSLEGDK